MSIWKSVILAGVSVLAFGLAGCEQEGAMDQPDDQMGGMEQPGDQMGGMEQPPETEQPAQPQ